MIRALWKVGRRAFASLKNGTSRKIRIWRDSILAIGWLINWPELSRWPGEHIALCITNYKFRALANTGVSTDDYYRSHHPIDRGRQLRSNHAASHQCRE